MEAFALVEGTEILKAEINIKGLDNLYEKESRKLRERITENKIMILEYTDRPKYTPEEFITLAKDVINILKNKEAGTEPDENTSNTDIDIGNLFEEEILPEELRNAPNTVLLISKKSINPSTKISKFNTLKKGIPL